MVCSFLVRPSHFNIPAGEGCWPKTVEKSETKGVEEELEEGKAEELEGGNTLVGVDEKPGETQILFASNIYFFAICVSIHVWKIEQLWWKRPIMQKEC